MQVPYSWLKEYLKTKLTSEELAEQFTLSGSEVEKVEHLKKLDEKIIIGEIKTIVKHPQANRLQIAKVDIGKDRVFDIVCGADNIKPGQKVPVAQVGAKLANGLVIEAAVIRGYKSLGMLCAEDELGLGDDHQGIYILDNDFKVGQTLNQALGTGDTILHFALTPNRADCFSIVGLAREAAAVLNIPWQPPKWALADKDTKDKPIAKHMRVSVREQKLCPRYTARYIKDVQVGPAPLWIKNRLIKAGIKSINNIVDITNYVMLESGQPLHAFDASLVSNQSIIVRRARAGEKIMTLDEEVKKLDNTTLVIADAKKVVAIAGVMGGQDSGISQSTRTVILESAVFNPVSIRQTSQKLELRTESSHRFEKGVDMAMTPPALDRAAKLISELAGGQIVNGRIDTPKQSTKDRSVTASITKINDLLNTNLSAKKIAEYLGRLGLAASIKKDNLTVKVPSWRFDINIAEDLAEEVARLHGYNKLKPTLMSGQLKPVGLPIARQMERTIKDFLVGKGLTEVMTYSYYGEEEKLLFDGGPLLEIANPLSQEQKYMRGSLIPSLFTILKKQDQDFIGIFEIGDVFRPKSNTVRPAEHRQLGLGYIIREGKANQPPETRLQYRWLRSIVDSLLAEFNISDPQYVNNPQSGWLVKIDIKSGGQLIGTIAITALPKKPKVLFAMVELNFDQLLKLASPPEVSEKPKYQTNQRDIAFWVKDSVQWQAIDDSLNNISDLITGVELFDIYHSAERRNQRSLAVRFTIQAKDRTLKGQEVDNLIKEIIIHLRDKFGAQIRDK
ncbi:phenylalanine--tRNA ligase subunit beta [Patescibacteria group bacterium]